MKAVIPIRIGSPECGGPFELELGAKDGFNFQSLLGFDFELDDGAGFVDGREKCFPNLKIIAGVKDGGRFRADGDCASEGFGRQRFIIGMENQRKLAKELQRLEPALHSSCLVAENCGLLTDGAQKLPRAHGAGDFQGRLSVCWGCRKRVCE